MPSVFTTTFGCGVPCPNSDCILFLLAATPLTSTAGAVTSMLEDNGEDARAAASDSPVKSQAATPSLAVILLLLGVRVSVSVILALPIFLFFLPLIEIPSHIYCKPPTSNLPYEI